MSYAFNLDPSGVFSKIPNQCPLLARRVGRALGWRYHLRVWVARRAAWVALSTCQHQQVTCTASLGASWPTMACSLDLVTCKRNQIIVRRALTCEPTFASGGFSLASPIFYFPLSSHLRMLQSKLDSLCCKICPSIRYSTFVSSWPTPPPPNPRHPYKGRRRLVQLRTSLQHRPGTASL